MMWFIQTKPLHALILAVIALVIYAIFPGFSTGFLLGAAIGPALRFFRKAGQEATTSSTL